jgi:hypothetical protein
MSQCGTIHRFFARFDGNTCPNPKGIPAQSPGFGSRFLLAEALVALSVCNLFLTNSVLAQAGTVDSSFNPGSGVNGGVFALVLQPDGRTLLVGDFTRFNGTNRSQIARLEANGSLDLSFDPGTGMAGGIFFGDLFRRAAA